MGEFVGYDAKDGLLDIHGKTRRTNKFIFHSYSYLFAFRLNISLGMDSIETILMIHWYQATEERVNPHLLSARTGKTVASSDESKPHVSNDCLQRRLYACARYFVACCSTKIFSVFK